MDGETRPTLTSVEAKDGLMRISALLGASAALLIATPGMAAVSIGNTGVGTWSVKSNGSTAPGNGNAATSGNQPAAVVVTNPVWFANTSTSSWVSTNASGVADPGYYTYFTTFSSTGVNQALNFLYAVDDKITAVYLDGNSITVAGSDLASYDKFYNGSINVAMAGSHTLAFVTSNNFPGQNNGANPAGFRFQVAAVPEPATWAMMLMGFAMVGAASRYRRRGAKVTFA